MALSKVLDQFYYDPIKRAFLYLCQDPGEPNIQKHKPTISSTFEHPPYAKYAPLCEQLNESIPSSQHSNIATM